MQRLKRARLSLEGLSVGDALGQRMFIPEHFVSRLIESRRLPAPPWYFTDDTNMALSIVAILKQYSEINQDQLAQHFGKYYDAKRGYGPAMHELLARYAAGERWQDLAPNLFNGQGSFGNGAAMRVAPVGAYFADDLTAAVENARRSAEITHAHPEAIAGAIAIAGASAFAWQLRDTIPTREDFLDRILPLVPPGEVHDGIRRARDLPERTSVEHAITVLGNGSEISAQDTVPFVLWCAGQFLNNYENAIWLAISGMGDVDTTCAMVGGIVIMVTGLDGIPAEWHSNREPLPDWAFG